MNFTKLEKNMIDVIQENQIKLGYRKEKIRLYYPLESLCRFLEVTVPAPQMQRMLTEYFRDQSTILQNVEVSEKDNRFCLLIPETAVEMVHERAEANPFLEEFIAAVQKENGSIESLVAIFEKYGREVHFEDETKDSCDFDYLLYFGDGRPDDYRYCLTREGSHMIYHRFTPEDYRDML